MTCVGNKIPQFAVFAGNGATEFAASTIPSCPVLNIRKTPIDETVLILMGTGIYWFVDGIIPAGKTFVVVWIVKADEPVLSKICGIINVITLCVPFVVLR